MESGQRSPGLVFSGLPTGCVAEHKQMLQRRREWLRLVFMFPPRSFYFLFYLILLLFILGSDHVAS